MSLSDENEKEAFTAEVGGLEGTMPIIQGGKPIDDKPEPIKAYMIMEVEQWVFDKSAPEFEKSISDEAERIAADFKDFFLAKYLARKNGVN